MTRPYTPYSPTRTPDVDDLPTDDFRQDYRWHSDGSYRAIDTGHADYRDFADPADGPDDDVYGDYGDFDGQFEGDSAFMDEAIDRRWIWVAGVAGAVLLVAVICTVVILGGGDSGSVAAPITAPATTSQQPTASAAPSATSARPLPPATPLPPETVTTVTPTPSATAPQPTAPAQASAPAPTAPAPAAAVPGANPRAVTYTITGNRQLFDLVTVVYTDQQGALQTDFNVALPWTKTVVLNPGVQLSSVTATSVAGQLNCRITDSMGNPIAAQQGNTIITNCTK